MRHHKTSDRTSIAAALLVLVGVSAGAASSQDVCKDTAKIAFGACKDGAHAAKEVVQGKCLNLPAPDRKTCNEQSGSDVQDAVQTCIDGRAVREAACARFGPAAYHPAIDPTNFVAGVSNRYFPLNPGTTFVYESHPSPDVLSRTEFAVTRNTKTILGVTCIEVRDTVTNNGELVEDTLDWFAQDRAGNVWYFGENTMELAGGRPTTLDGTFVGGIDGAQPGIIMEATPAFGDFYRQEFDLANAEDFAEVVSLDESVMAGGVPYPHTLKTKETTPLEPDLVENKYYALGVGNVLTVDLSTGERSELISVTP